MQTKLPERKPLNTLTFGDRLLLLHFITTRLLAARRRRTATTTNITNEDEWGFNETHLRLEFHVCIFLSIHFLNSIFIY
jgi:hypothetical protein